MQLLVYVYDFHARCMCVLEHGLLSLTTDVTSNAAALDRALATPHGLSVVTTAALHIAHRRLLAWWKPMACAD